MATTGLKVVRMRNADCRDVLLDTRKAGSGSRAREGGTACSELQHSDQRQWHPLALLEVLTAMAAPSQQARSALCIGDPDAFQSEMIKMINDREFRSAEMKFSGNATI